LREKISIIIRESLEISAFEYNEKNELLKCPTWDSLGILSLIGNLKEKLNISIEVKNLDSLIYFKDLVSFILSKK
jgi:acyl carrier protein